MGIERGVRKDGARKPRYRFEILIIVLGYYCAGSPPARKSSEGPSSAPELGPFLLGLQRSNEGKTGEVEAERGRLASRKGVQNVAERKPSRWELKGRCPKGWRTQTTV